MTVPNTHTDVFNAGREESVAAMALAYIDDRGVVFTKSCVVNFILDLFGYWKLGAKSVNRILLPLHLPSTEFHVNSSQTLKAEY
jgi:hypothetical protein